MRGSSPAAGPAPQAVDTGRVRAYGVTAAFALPAPGPPGIQDVPARLVVEGGLAVIVSDRRGPAFGQLPKEELLRCLLAHQRVLESLAGDRGVLPLELGTEFESEERAREFLAECSEAITSHLEELGDRLEVEVAATWEVGQVLAGIAQEPEVVEARKAITAAGEPSLEDRARLGRLVKARLDQRREAYGRRIGEWLRPLAVEAAANPLLSDDLVANLACLVERTALADLETGVRELDRAFEGRVNLRLIGPMPPYTFGTLRLRRVTRQQVSAASRLLGLKPQSPLTPEGIRHAYRRQAAAAQALPERLGALREASENLAALGGLAIRPGREDRWLITVRRPAVEDIQPSRFGGGVGF